jgi:hypothetical protein
MRYYINSRKDILVVNKNLTKGSWLRFSGIKQEFNMKDFNQDDIDNLTSAFADERVWQEIPEEEVFVEMI